MAWTDAARQAAIETRRANAAAKKQNGPRPTGQPKPVTGRRPAQMAGKPNTNAGNKAAFSLRNKMAHDAGKDARIAAANARTPAAHQIGIHASTGGRMSPGAAALLGSLLGAGGKILSGLKMNRGGR
jgi:hypothetical protein